MYGAQPGYQNGQQWPQQGFGHARNCSGPPPAKKPKNNPIITRYAPPPGYRGPAAPPASYQASMWQQHPRTYGQGQTAYPGYPAQAYAQQAYGQPAYDQPAYGRQSYGQTGQTHLQAPHPNGQHAQQYGQPQYAGYPPNAYPQQASYQHPAMPPSQQPASWQPPLSISHSASPPNHWSSADMIDHHSRQTSISVSQSRNGYFDPYEDEVDFDALRAIYAGVTMQELESDYFEECYYASHQDEVDPKYSLGFLTYTPALPMKRALPATWQLAEVEAIAPRKDLPTDDESISEYFINEKRHEALLSVRQTPLWEEVKDDLIYQEFPAVCENIISRTEVLEKYRDRRDGTWTDREPSATPEPEVRPTSSHSRAYEDDVVDDAPDVNGHGRFDDRRSSVAMSESSDVSGNFEQALQPTQPQRRPSQAVRTRTMSSNSTSGRSITRPQPLMPIRDAAQENVLAALGVTGSPKLVYETPGPALGAPQPRRDNGESGHSRDSSTSGMHDGGARRRPPPPPPPPSGGPSDREYRRRSRSDDPWRMDSHQPYRNGRRGSTSSQHTTTGSDFGDGDQERTPRPRIVSNGAKKRNYDEAQDGALNEIPEMDEDATPRPRYKHPRVSDAYSRRW